MTCYNCQWWRRFDKVNDMGECRRYPPRENHQPFGGNIVLAEWVQTSLGDWCGEFKQKEGN